MSRQRGLVWYKTPVLWLSETPIGNFWLLLLLLCSTTAGIAWYIRSGAPSSWTTYLRTLVPIAIVAGAMWSKLGNPLNWWRPFFGTVMVANKEKLAVREKAGEDSKAIQQELEAWVREMTKSRFYKVNPYTYKFLRKGDAAMFKLAWM